MKTRTQLENIKTGLLAIACALFVTIAITPSQVMRSYVFAQFEEEGGGAGRCRKAGVATFIDGIPDCDCTGQGSSCSCTFDCPPKND